MYMYYTGDSTTARKPRNPIISAIGDSNSAFLDTLVHKKNIMADSGDST